MTITRLNYFQAIQGKEDDLIAAFKAILPVIRAADGCLSCNLFVDAMAPGKITIIEEWVDTDHHQAAAQKVDPATFQKIMAMLDGKPSGQYYTAINIQ